jgi:ketol-acid reductoisomerase
LQQSVRGVKTLDFAGSQEVVYERSDWPLAKLQDYFKNDTLALIGYGSQGHGQGLNARDNGLKVIVGVRENGESWKQALEDGWVRAHNVSLASIAMLLTLVTFFLTFFLVVYFD